MRKLYQYSALTILAAFACVSSCKDEDLVIVPEWESGVHGLGEFSSSSEDVNFIKGDPSVDLTIDLLWNSIDKKNTVTKIDLYIAFNEAYTDADGNPKVANHGGERGKLLMTLEGSTLPGDKEPTTFTISQDDVFALYDGSEYNYGSAAAPDVHPVWGDESIRDDRDTEDFKFVNGDAFELSWIFTTDDGRVFDKWGISVCTEFPGANCVVNWSAVCSQVINEPAGDWTINFEDTYGDGWNGAKIKVVVDGVGTEYTLDDGGEGVEVVTVPPGTSTLTFEFIGGDYDSEVIYSIVSGKGNTIAKAGPSPTPGVITLDLCLENE